MRRFDAVLFDLDNTLLVYNSEEEFFYDYLRLAAEEFADVCPPEEFTTKLLASTEDMIKNVDTTVSNHEAFITGFCPAIGLDAETVVDRLMRFYETKFRRLSRHARPAVEARNVINSAKDAGMQVAVATNPVFPRTAVEERLSWARLDDVRFDLVTTYEAMHACKPSPEYYLEVASKLGVSPDRCVMVGNDPVDDCAAKLAGMTVYLVDHGSWRGVVDDGPEPDYRGALADVIRLWSSVVAG